MIQMSNINKYYNSAGQVVHALKDITLNVEKGEMVSIMGPSGSGKSTLVNILGFIDIDYEGEYLYKNKSFFQESDTALAKLRNKTVGFVFQEYNLIANNTVLENIALPLLYNNFKYPDIRKLILNTLARIGLEGKENNYPKQLSGGQQQRVAIARAIINNPEFIIADEPTGSLDAETAVDIMNLLYEINTENGTTIIIVTHNYEITTYCNRLIQLNDGYIAEDRML